MVFTTIQGSLHAMGRELGKVHQLAVWRVAAESRRRFHTGNCNVPAMNKALKKREHEVRDVIPKAWEHLKGISEGSGVPLQDLILINFGIPNLSVLLKESCCNIAGFQKSPQGPIVGGNVDDPAWHYISRETPESGYAAIFVSLPGYYAKWGGMNEHGLCMTGASAGAALPGTADDVAPPRKPSLSIGPVRDVLTQCRTVAEALEMMKDVRYSGNNYMIGDPENVVQVEGHGNGTWNIFRETAQAPLCAGNVQRSYFEKYGDGRYLRRFYGNALGRHLTLQAATLKNMKSPGVAAMQRVLTGHGHGRRDIDAHSCVCHPGTSVSLIGIPRRRMVLIGFAPPCVSGYKSYRVPCPGRSQR